MIKPKEVRRYQPYVIDSCKELSQLSQISQPTELNDIDFDLSSIKTEMNPDDTVSLDTQDVLDESSPDISSQLSTTTISGLGLTNESQGNSQELDNGMDEESLLNSDLLNETASMPLFE